MNQSIVMKKQELRNRYLQRRNDLSVQQRKEKSIQVLQNLQTLPEFQKAEGVLIYLNYLCGRAASKEREEDLCSEGMRNGYPFL